MLLVHNKELTKLSQQLTFDKYILTCKTEVTSVALATVTLLYGMWVEPGSRWCLRQSTVVVAIA